MKTFLKKSSRYVILFFTCSFSLAEQSFCQAADYGVQVGYGYSVGASVLKGDTMFLGGDFDYVGFYTGSMVSVDLGTAGVSKSFPVVNGTVRTMISDGSGGYYIGGNFTRVDGKLRIGLAHILSNKSLDLAWNINIDNGSGVYALLLSPSRDTLWLGGTFSTVDGINKDKLAAIKVSTRSVISGWDAGSVNKNWWAPAVVCALAYYQGTSSYPARLYVGGDFSGFNWTLSRANLAALNPATGAPMSDWKADVIPQNGTTTFTPVSPVVRTLAVDNGSFYLLVGGLFTGITDKNLTFSTHSITALSVTDGTRAIASPVTIQPLNDTGYINCIKLIKDGSGGLVWGIAGKFTQVGSINVQNFTLMGRFGGVTTYQGATFVNGRVVDTTFTPGVYAPGEICNFDTLGSTVFLAGDFEGIQSSSATVQVRRNLAALDMTTNTIRNWVPPMQTNMPVRGLILSGSEALVAGSFTSAGGSYRKNAAAVNLRSKVVLPFNPQPDSYVNAFEFSTTKDTLYLAGNFTLLGPQQRGYTAAIDLRTNTVLPWGTTIATGGGVEDIKLDPYTQILYVGGKFTTMAGKPRNHLAALNALKGNVIKNWVADVATINGQITPVRTLAVMAQQDTIFVGGRFNNIGGQPMKNLAALTTKITTFPADTTASLLAWNLPVAEAASASDIGVCALTIYSGRLYAGGKFDAIGGNTSIKNLAAINLNTSPISLDVSWNPSVQGGGGGVNCIQASGSTLYIGGDFGTINGNITSFAGAINIPDATALVGWVPYPSVQPFGGTVLTMAMGEPWVYIGGSQEYMTQGINDAVFHIATIPSLASLLPIQWNSFTVQKSARGVLLQWEIADKDAFLEIQRSNDGVNFASISHPFSGRTMSQYEDVTVSNGNIYYYRIKIMSTFATYTPIKSVSFLTVPNAHLLTNLVTSGEVIITASEAGYLFQLYNANGQSLVNQYLNAGTNTLATSRFSRGVYFYNIIKGRQSLTGKLLLQ